MKRRTVATLIFAGSMPFLPASGAFAACGDVNDSASVTASDALGILKLAVGQNFAIDCGPIGGLLVTSQTTCHNSTNGNEIDCEGTGQDGEFQRGAERSFKDNGDGTVTDRVTGLVWEKHSDDDGIHDRDNKYTWDNAFLVKIATLNTSNFAGHNDWRLPNQFELYSLVHHGKGYPATFDELNNNCTPGCSSIVCACYAAPSYAWSSTTNAAQPVTAWIQNLLQGEPFPNSKSLEFGARAVRAGYVLDEQMLAIKEDVSFTPVFVDKSCADVNVSDTVTAQDSLAVLKKAVGQAVDLHCALRRPLMKTGQSKCYNTAGLEIPCLGTRQDGELRTGTARSFTNNGNGTITDNRTGLMWEVLSMDKSFHNAGSQFNWTGAVDTKIATLNSANFAGHDDWRVPNVFELHSLDDLGEKDPTIHGVFNANCQVGCSPTECSCSPTAELAWTSTSYATELGNAWNVDFLDGQPSGADKSDLANVRAVRAGW